MAVEKKIILHIITRDKFTSGYINFMKIKFPDIEHFFCISKEGFKLSLIDENNLMFYSTGYDFIFNKELFNHIMNSNKIIISGLFDDSVIKALFYFNRDIWNKIYLQFWGGDFYQFREVSGFKKKKMLFFEAIMNCGGIINLIADDYEVLRRIFGIKKEIMHYVAVMPGDPLQVIDFSAFRHNTKNNGFLRILVGNSATKENCHTEVFELLTKYLTEKMEIICPLSYGEKEYKEEIIKIGKKVFGEKFLPILEFYEKEDYIKLLSTCDVGIFGNNRQQAMGNIEIMIQLGKKIFLRNNTSMYCHYKNLGIKTYCLDDISKVSFFEFRDYSLELAEKNIICLENYYQSFVCGWLNVFDSIKESKKSTKGFKELHYLELLNMSKQRIKMLLKLILPKRVVILYKSYRK